MRASRPLGVSRTARSRNVVLGILLVLACSPVAPSAQRTARNAPRARRAILVSFDSFNEQRARETVDTSAIPAIRALLDSSACAEYARPAFPSYTAPGHASLWTGAYGDVNGISGNSQPQLPRDRHTLLDVLSGYSSDALRAEPIWISAAASGRVIVAHHPTQAPRPPGYRAIHGEPNDALRAARAHAEAALVRANVHVVNGYNSDLAPHRVITERTVRPRPAVGWQGLDRIGGGQPPLELAWKAGDDSIFALLHGRDRYTHVLVAVRRATDGAVAASAEPVEQAPFAGRELARHFSPSLRLPLRGGRVFVRVRLFALAPDASSFALYQTALHGIDANRSEVETAYTRAVEGWLGNGASRVYESGAFGPPLWEGGDGTAEARYMESLELLTRQSMLGVEWGWNEMGASLLIDYFPLIDEVEHILYGYVLPGTPHYEPALAARIQQVRQRAWMLADLRMAQLRGLVAASPQAALFVSGDHGMRVTWRTFRPNVALARAGLLALDSAGRIDLSRTRALSPNGYWVMVNSTDWKGGIVPPAEVPAVLAAAERALLEAHGVDGTRVVTRVWRAAEHDSLGMGGPVGGALYYSLAEGYYWTRDARGALTSDTEPQADHGFPSVERDMYTVLCAHGRAFAPRRIGPARTIDAAPTVAEWLGVAAPRESVGRSRLGAMRGVRGEG